jgi:hypothetical protein
MEAARDLLESKPTGEAQLLSILVNKFGDPDRKVSSRAIHLLQVIHFCNTCRYTRCTSISSCNNSSSTGVVLLSMVEFVAVNQ